MNLFVHGEGEKMGAKGVRWVGVLLALAVGGCGGDLKDPGTSLEPDATNNDPGLDAGLEPDGEGDDLGLGGDSGDEPSPRIQFLVNPRPHDPETDFEPAEIARYGDPFVIVAEGLPPGSAVRLDVESADYGAYGVFKIQEDGTLDLRRDAPLEGTWEGIDPEGVVWSARALRPPGPLDLTVRASISLDGELLAAGELARRFVNEGVVVEEVAEGAVVGTLALPQGEGPFPGVMIFGGSEGGLGFSEFAALQMAQLGYAAFGVAYFGAPGVPSNLVRIPLEQLEADLAWFADHPKVDGQRLAVMGGSRGGELALLLGAYLPDVKAVVANVPSGLVWGGLTFIPQPAWTWQSVALPFMPSARSEPRVEVDEEGVEHVSYRNTFLDSMAEADPAAVEAATIPVEQTGGPILMIAGDDDQLWPSCPLAQVAWDRLQASGHVERHGDVMVCFEGAGHNIGRPGFSTLDNTEYFDPRSRSFTVMGGSPKGIGAAQRAADTELRRFLEAALMP